MPGAFDEIVDVFDGLVGYLEPDVDRGGAFAVETRIVDRPFPDVDDH